MSSKTRTRRSYLTTLWIGQGHLQYNPGAVLTSCGVALPKVFSNATSVNRTWKVTMYKTSTATSNIAATTVGTCFFMAGDSLFCTSGVPCDRCCSWSARSVTARRSCYWLDVSSEGNSSVVVSRSSTSITSFLPAVFAAITYLRISSVRPSARTSKYRRIR